MEYKLLYGIGFKKSNLISLDHAVADTDLGEDIARLGGGFLYLAADVRHVDTQGLIVALGAGAPQLLDDDRRAFVGFLSFI